MNLNFLKNKKTRVVNNEVIVDLLEPTLVIDRSSKNYVITRIFVVTDDYVMRPDLISFAAYGSDQYVDLILKANEISNPFSIDVGDVILIPSKEAAATFYKIPKKEEKTIEETKSKFIDPSKKNSKDDSRIEKLKKLAEGKKNKATEIKPPTAKRSNENSFISKNGKLSFSPNKSKRR